MFPFLYFTFDTCFLVMTFTVLSNFNMKNHVCEDIKCSYISLYLSIFLTCPFEFNIDENMYSKLNFKLNNWSQKIRNFFFHRRTDGCKLICKDILLLTKKTQKIKDANVRFALCISFLQRNPRLFCTPNFQRVQIR